MNLEQLLSTPKLTDQVPQANLIRERAGLVTPQPIKLFYGETYDEAGHPVDSMKYYLFVSFLADALRQEGFDVDPSILIADSAACRNVGEKNEKYYMTLGEERYHFVERVNEIYGTGLRLVKMSDYINSPEFIDERNGVMEVCKADQELMSAVEKTVPESKVDIERSKEFLYSFDEITTIMDLDVKVGPPREDLYDNVARTIARQRGQKELMSLFLAPTFPVGMSWAYFFANEGIEDNGITAYKAASKRLQRNRIIVGHSNPDYVRDLMRDSFISTNPVLPNPVLDIGIICEMARKRLERDNSPITLADDFYGGGISEKQLKEKVGNDVDEYILSKF
ncbi:hypothetical protein KKE03_04765 [Patescibacteria group bacterium]|nr:hypothetical protein [Patescibacteria group bacterium]